MSSEEIEQLKEQIAALTFRAEAERQAKEAERQAKEAAEQAKEAAEQAKEAAEEAVKAERRKFIDLGLPPLGKKDGTTTSNAINEKHAPAQLIVKPFSRLSELALHEGASNIWASLNMSWSTEADIAALVTKVLEDAIIAAGFKEDLKLRRELGLFRVRSDLWVVTSGGYPLGAVEVKKPDHAGYATQCILDNERVAGQVLDYMLRLKHFFGVQHPFGIVATYDQWRFCWFSESDEYANATAINTTSKPPEVLDVDTDEEQDQEEEEIDDPNEASYDYEGDEDDTDLPPDTSPRVLHASAIYAWNHKDLNLHLVSIIHKMYHSPINRVNPLQVRHCVRIFLNPEQWYWTKFPRLITRINDTRLPSGSARKFIMLRDLRGGADGRVYRACTTSGIGCVIKFSACDDKAQAKMSLEKEAALWESVWEIPVRVITLDDKPALVMPYARAIKRDCPKSTKDLVRQAIQTMAAKHYKHLDLRWEHVGRLALNGRPVVLFDLARVASVMDVQHAEEAMCAMLGLSKVN